MKNLLYINLIWLLFSCGKTKVEPAKIQLVGTYNNNEIINQGVNNGAFWVAFSTNDFEIKAKLETIDDQGYREVLHSWSSDSITKVFDLVYLNDNIFSIHLNNVGQLIFQEINVNEGSIISELVLNETDVYENFKIAILNHRPHILGMVEESSMDLDWFIKDTIWKVERRIGYNSVDESLKRVVSLDNTILLCLESTRVNDRDVRCTRIDTLGLIISDLHFFPNDQVNQGFIDVNNDFILLENHSNNSYSYQIRANDNLDIAVNTPSGIKPYCMLQELNGNILLVNFYYNGNTSEIELQSLNSEGNVVNSEKLELSGYHEPSKIYASNQSYYLTLKSELAFDSEISLMILNKNGQ